MEQIAQKICIYQIKVVPLQMFSYLNLIYGEIVHPSQRLRGVFYCLFGLKNCPFYEKSTFL